MVIGIVGLFALLLSISMFWIWFASLRVNIDRRKIRIKSSIFGIGRTKELDASEVASIETSEGIQSGTKIYYNLTLVSKDGTKYTVGTGLSGSDGETLKKVIEPHIRAEGV